MNSKYARLSGKPHDRRYRQVRRRTFMVSVKQALKDDLELAKSGRSVIQRVLPKVLAEARTVFTETMSSLSGPPQG